jgi:hypothetical protein
MVLIFHCHPRTHKKEHDTGTSCLAIFVFCQQKSDYTYHLDFTPRFMSGGCKTTVTYRCHVLGQNIVLIESIPLNAMDWSQANGYQYIQDSADKHGHHPKGHTSSCTHCSSALLPSQLIWTMTGSWRSS